MSNRKQWTTRDGKNVRIKDMSTDHIVDAMRLLARYAKVKYEEELAIAFCASHMVSGEQASYMCDQAVDELIMEGQWQDCLPDIYIDLEEEFKRRERKAFQDTFTR
jgi:hypothetical protein